MTKEDTDQSILQLTTKIVPAHLANNRIDSNAASGLFQQRDGRVAIANSAGMCKAGHVKGMATKWVSHNRLLNWFSDAWPRTRQKQPLEEWNNSGRESNRLSTFTAILVWIVLSVLLWGGLLAPATLIL
jgi:hypothetical protein